MAEIPSALPPLPQTSAAPGQQDYASGTNGSSASYMPPPPLPPVVIPANNNPVPTAVTTAFNHDNNMSSPSSGVRRAAPEPNKRALYVGGLDFRVTEDVLRQIFETTGHVQNVKIIPDKNNKGYNYGFVEYDDPGAADRAMATLNGRRVHSQEIRVNWAYQSNNSAKEDTSNHFHIFVGDLSNEVNDEVLNQAFSVFGVVSEARVMWDMKTGRSRGYGFVAFRDYGEAEKALSSMDGEWLGSRAIRCNWANQKGQPSIAQQQAMLSGGMTPTTPAFGAVHHNFPTAGVQSYDMIVQQTPSWQTTVYVGNLTPYTTQNDLVPLFQNFGYVVETRFQADRGFAFVKMDTHENAAMAICQLSGYNVNGRPLKCSWGKDRPPTGQFDTFSPQAPASAPTYGQASPATYGYPQYGAGPLSPQGPQAGSTVANYSVASAPPQAPGAPRGYGAPAYNQGQASYGQGQGQGGYGQNPAAYGQSSGGYGQAPSGYASTGYPNQGYGSQGGMPGSVGGYGQDQASTGGWTQQVGQGYPRSGPAAGPANGGAGYGY